MRSGGFVEGDVPWECFATLLNALARSLKGTFHMEVDNSWLPTLLCALNDGIRYNDRLKHTGIVKDPGDIEEWLLQIHQFKQYLRERLSSEPKLLEQYGEYPRD